jgi:TRAP-type C4-dicarboxylate transport system substrate-binding protein
MPALSSRAAILGLTAALVATQALAAGERHFSFGYDQPHTTGYGIAADMFAAKLSDLSKGQVRHRSVPRRAARPGATDAAIHERQARLLTRLGSFSRDAA